MGHIQSSCDLYPVVDVPMTIYKDNATCIEQLKKGYIKGDNIKHIGPKFFFSHQQKERQKIEVTQNNLATFLTLVQRTGMHKLSEL